MNREVTDFIAALTEPWQQELSSRLCDVVHQAIPGMQERIQYKKPPKTTKLRKRDTFDAGQLESFVSEAASSL
jgi:hypothetical protein